MKHYLFFFIAFCVASVVYSQNNKTMVDSITSQSSGKGKITIHQEAGITNLIGKINSSGSSSLKSTVVSRKGYRIQVYSGSSQQKNAKDEAYARERKIRGRLPYSTYVSFNSPFWKVRVGDFSDRPSAEAAVEEIKKTCPEYSSELYIVRDDVNIRSVE